MKRVWLLAGCCMMAWSCGGGEDGTGRVCEPGEVQCGAEGVERCSESGKEWLLEQACADGATCSEGMCLCDGGRIPGVEGCVEWKGKECLEGFGPKEGVPGCYQMLDESECSTWEMATAAKCAAVGVTQCPDVFVEMAEEGGCQAEEGECQVAGVGSTGWRLCEPVETPCAEGVKWAELPEWSFSDVVYVDAGAAAGGTGSVDSPYKTLGEALATAGESSVILVAAGTYAEGLHIQKGVEILGVCSGQVTLTGGVSAALDGWMEQQRFAVWIDTDKAVGLSGVTIAGDVGEGAEPLSGVLASPGADFHVKDVVLTGMTGACIAAVDPASVLVEGIACLEPLALDTSPLGPNGLGVYVSSTQGVPAEIRGSRFFKVQGYDIWLSGVAGGEIQWNWFEGRGVWSGQEPMGVRLDGVVALEVSGNRFKDKMQHALYAVDSDVLVGWNYVDGLISDYEDINGPVVKVVGGKAVVEANRLSGNQFGGVLFEKSTGEIRGNVIEGTYPSDPGQKGGDGIVLTGCTGADVVVTGNTLFANTRNGVLISGSNALVEGNLIVDMEPSPLSGSDAAAAINVVAKSTAKVKGNRLRRNRANGIRVDASFGSVTGNEVKGVTGHPLGGCAAGIRISESFLGEVSGNRVDGVTGVGIWLEGGKINEVQGNAVVGSKGSERGPGVGIRVEGSNTDLSGNVVRGADDVGIWADALSGSINQNLVEGCGGKSGLGGVVVGNVVNPPVQVEGNTVASCVGRGMSALNVYGGYLANVVANTAAFDGALGIGVWVQGEGEFSLSRNWIEGGLAAGILLKDAPSVTIGSTVVKGVKAGKLPFGAKLMDAAEGVVVLTGSIATLVNCLVVGAEGSGLYIGQAAEATLANCEVRDNGASGVEAVGTLDSEGLRLSGNGAGGVSENTGRMLSVDELIEPAVCEGD